MKIKTFITILFVCFSIDLHSQEGKIIYTDFEPDSVFVVPPIYDTTSVISFDIDYDNDYDFSFYYDGVSYGLLYVIRCYGEGNPRDWQVAIVKNDTIPNIQEHLWHIHRVFEDAPIVPNEGLYVEMEKKMAIRHDLNDTTSCYGWVRFQFKYGWGVPGTVTLYDMAYCTVPNYPLRFGQKSFDDTATYEIAENKGYVLYPSPAKDRLALRFNNNNESCNEIRIYSIDGRLLKTQNDNFEDIDVSNLPSGVYIMKIISANGEVSTEKFVKE